jgi:FKBP-type peptidyl-prolyl cis-trans isomerase
MKYHLLIGVGAVVFIAVLVVSAVSRSSQPVAAAAKKYPGEAVTGEPVKLPSGLMYYDLKVGDGPTPAGPTSTVRVHYTGWLEKTGKKFDSSVDRGQPASFQLDGVIPGWTEGVGSMKVGGKRKLIIPGPLAYPEGRPNIPPGAPLVFDIELLGLE